MHTGRQLLKKTILIIGLTAALLACKAQEQRVAAATSSATSSQSLPPGHPPIDMATTQVSGRPAASAQGTTIRGEIVETMNAGGYTYMRLATSDGDVWTAVPATNVKKGTVVSVDVQMLAEKFESTTLHRTFDKLAMGAISASPSADSRTDPMAAAAQHMTSPADAGDVRVTKVEGGLTIAETWAKRNELKGKQVVIRGKVVKFLSGIMGKNWIHLRDGSGSHAQHNDEITVTTLQSARLGDIITVTGTVHVDIDLGSGYVYPVIIEDAKVN
jgi:hypothetical protein